MEQPIHTFFKYLKEDDTKYLSYDCITRYYEMLRYLMKNNKIFGGKKPIQNLYKYSDDYKETFSTSNYTLIDIILFQMKLETIKDKFLTDPPNIKAERKIILNAVKNILDTKSSKRIHTSYIIIPLSFIFTTFGFLFINQYFR